MSPGTVEAIIRWQQQSSLGRCEGITFHGGEPLIPGAPFYRKVLPLLHENLSLQKVAYSVQSNLWLLSDELCKLFLQYHVSLSTSLDGPETINDAQRGKGNFQKTMTGIQYARSRGLDAGCICTFTSRSASQANKVFDFFMEQGMGLSIHAALQPLGSLDNDLVLAPESYGKLLTDLFQRYLKTADRIRIHSLDAMCRSISAGMGGICTFTDCLGHYYAIDPEGWIYPCQRMAGMTAFRLGNVHDCPTMSDLEQAPVWKAMKMREEIILEKCKGCPHLTYCLGGCPYNVLAVNESLLGNDPRDPYCPAYKQVFEMITEHALAEVFSEENLTSIMKEGITRNGLLQKGKLLQIMCGGPHPQETARQARMTLAAAALGACRTPEAALAKLELAGAVTDHAVALANLRTLRKQLDTQSAKSLSNLYLHVTNTCNLTCRHCYAVSNEPDEPVSMKIEKIDCLVRQAAKEGFDKIVITGGEPLMHPQRKVLLNTLAALRQIIKPMKMTLRTNLAYPMSDECMNLLLRAVDEIVVSLDGNQSSHDAQRGEGTYTLTVENLRRLRVLQGGCNAAITLAASLIQSQIEGPEAESVRLLGEELGFSTQFKPILPLGRGSELDLKLTLCDSPSQGFEKLACHGRIASTCGLGMNLFIGPDGSAYPCHALMLPRHYLGNAVKEGLAHILISNGAYRAVTVDSNGKCNTCALRYLCGGFCRAWGDREIPDAPPCDCKALYKRAEDILRAALEVMGITAEKWEYAGLPSFESQTKAIDR